MGQEIGVWIDRSSLFPGTRWRSSIGSAIRDTGVFLALTTPMYRDSGPCRHEFDLARELGKFIICVGEAPWEWDGWPPQPPAAIAVKAADGETVLRLLTDRLELGWLTSRLELGRQQAQLEYAAERFEQERVVLAYGGREGWHQARRAVSDLRAAGIPVSNRIVEFTKILQRRKRRRRSAKLVATVLTLTALVVAQHYVAVLDKDRQASKTEADRRSRAANSETMTGHALKMLHAGQAEGSWDALEPLELAAKAYDQAPTASAVSALREALSATPHADDIRAVGLSGPVIATQLSAHGEIWGLTADGEFVAMGQSGSQQQHWRIQQKQPFRSGWIANDGHSVIILTGAGNLERWSTGGAREAVLDRSVVLAAADDALASYATARGTTVSLRGHSSIRPRKDPVRCTVRRPTAVTALALSPNGDTLVIGERSGLVTALNTASCAMRARMPYPIWAKDRTSAIVHVSAANRGRAVGFSAEDLVAIARPGIHGRYAATGFTDAGHRTFLSSDGSAAATSVKYFGLWTAIGDPLDALDVAVQAPLTLPGDGSTKSGEVTAASIGRTDNGGWAAAIGTAGGGLFFTRLDGVAGTARPAPRASDAPPDAGTRAVRLHPIGVMAGAVLATTAARPWEEPVDLEQWSPDTTLLWSHRQSRLVWADGSRWLTAPRGNTVALAHRTGRIVVVGPGGVSATVRVHGSAILTPSGRTLFSITDKHLERWDIALPTVRPRPPVRIVHPDMLASNPVVATAALGEDQVVVARHDGAVEVVDVATGHTARRRMLVADIRGLAASPDGRALVVLTTYALHLLTAPDLHLLGERPLTGGFRAQFSPDGTVVVARTTGLVLAVSVPSLFPVLQQQLSGGNDIIAYGPVAASSATVMLPDGRIYARCSICSTGNPALLQAAAGRVLNAAKVASR
jgi:hypothetical protein